MNNRIMALTYRHLNDRVLRWNYPEIFEELDEDPNEISEQDIEELLYAIDHKDKPVKLDSLEWCRSDSDDCTRRGYKHTQYIMQRPSPLFNVVLITATAEGKLNLSLIIRTLLEYDLIAKALRQGKTNLIGEYEPLWTGWDYSQLNRTAFCWELDLKKHNQFDIEMLFNDVFNLLTPLMKTPETKERFSLIKKKVGASVKKFFKYAYKKSGYVSHRCHVNDPYKIPLDSANGRELCEAITNFDVNKVFDLLSNHVDPNSYYRGFTALHYAINSKMLRSFYPYRSYAEEILSIIRLLLKLDAEYTRESILGLTCLEHTYNESIFNSEEKISIKVEFFDEIMNLFTASKTARQYLYLPEEEQNSLIGYLPMRCVVHGQNMFLKNLNDEYLLSPRIIKIAHQGNCFRYYMSDHNIITVTSHYGDELDGGFKDKLYELFETIFPWRYYAANFKNDIKEYYAYFIKQLPSATGVVECIHINDILVGFNMADITTNKDYGNKTIILHHPKLAVANEQLRKYHRFMSIIIYTRGFSLQINNPHIPVVTYSELVSNSGFLQTDHLDMYPKFKTLVEVITQIAEDLGECIPLEKGLYKKDELAVAKISGSHHSFWKPNELKAKVFEEHFQKDGHALLTGFINNEDNFNEFSSIVDRHCENTNFKKIVTLYAKKDESTVLHSALSSAFPRKL